MSEQKINNTFLKAHEQLDSLQKAFREGGKLEKAIAESGGDISVITAVSRALQEAANSIVSATTAKTLTEGVLDDNDDDGFMARSQLYFMAKDAIALHGMIDDRDDLEPWVHSKIVAASEGMDAVRRYMEYQKMSQPAAEPEMEPEMMTAEASSSRMVKEIEHLVKELDSDMNMNRHYGDVNIAKVVQMVQAGDIEGAADYAIGEYHDDDGGQDSGVLDGAYADMIDDLKWIVDNVSESFSDQVKDFGMFTRGGNAQVQNIIQYTLNDFDDAAEKATNSERDALRMEAMQKLFKELEDLAEDPKHEEAMDTDVRERAAAYLDQGIIRIMDRLDDVSEAKMTPADSPEGDPYKDFDQPDYIPGKKKKARPVNPKADNARRAHMSGRKERMVDDVNEGMEFDEKRNGELKTVAQDVFKNALSKAKKKAKK